MEGPRKSVRGPGGGASRKRLDTLQWQSDSNGELRRSSQSVRGCRPFAVGQPLPPCAKRRKRRLSFASAREASTAAPRRSRLQRDTGRAMSEENVEVVRNAIEVYNAFMRGELSSAALAETLDPQIEWHWHDERTYPDTPQHLGASQRPLSFGSNGEARGSTWSRRRLSSSMRRTIAS